MHLRIWKSFGLMMTVAGLTVGGLCSRATAITLIENGAPRAAIIVSQAALEPAKGDASAQKINLAAHDLQDYLRRISGAIVPIQSDASTPAGALILIGKSRATDAMKFDIPAGLTPARREEGFVIQSHGDRLVLAGNDAGPYHGTEYAVYEFLRRAGVRWFAPGEWGEVVPQAKTIATPKYSLRESPSFVQRNWWLHATQEMAELERRWKIRNGLNPDNMFAVPGDSSLRNFVPDASLAKTKPELFARNFDGTLNLNYPNLSNPETVKIAADKFTDFFRKNPDANSLTFSAIGIPRKPGRARREYSARERTRSCGSFDS